jgi:phosphoribosylformimino-5-aminoimidazole carboxamide ribotide isomerase
MMAGPNVEAMARMQRSVDVPVVASGGVTTVDDVRRLAEAGMAGCIIGRALYEGTIDLKEALHVAGV